MRHMISKLEGTSRQLPVAWGRDAAADRQTMARRSSEARLQAAVAVEHRGDDKDPYADVPCTD